MTQAETALHVRFGQTLSAHPILEDPHLARVLGRRTHRKYRDEPVARDLVEALLHVAFSASAKSDYQQASVVIVERADTRRRIADLVPSMPWIGSAPVFLIFCADAERLERVCALRGRPYPNRNLEAFFNASVDAALVMQTFVLAAEHVGLGCCPISVIRNHLAEITSILSLPERVIPVAGVCVGYPAEDGHVSMRLPPTVTRHVDRYGERDFAGEIDAYDRRRAERARTPREKQRSPERFGYADFYGWSEDKCRQLHGDEGSGFGALVRSRGFTLD
ncbi:MAG TPA: nitroreductase family protein [Beijerinckiaceae bacterium]|jgi:nitroreductase